MEESLRNSDNNLQWEMLYSSDTCKFPVERNTPVVSNNGYPSSVPAQPDAPGRSRPNRNVSSSPEREDIDYESVLENGNTSPMQEESSSIDGLSDESCSEDFQISRIGQNNGDESASDDDGGDFTVSRYMESKISRLDRARFGVWKVEVSSCLGRSSETWEVAGSSRSTEGPPLKLTLKKSQQEENSVEQRPEEDEGKKDKRKYKTKRELKDPGEPKDPQKRRGPGRPPSKNPPSISTRQRLLNKFKKKYFKDRKRWARSKSTFSMPPTIRSIAKP